MAELVATRAAALTSLQEFAPRMGHSYAQGRNYDNGKGHHTDVSTLSPYIRRRLITEQEVVTEATNTHGQKEASKFIEEVIWRGYFKGWLERRPQVWDSYVSGREKDLVALKRDRRLRRDVALAEAGETGLPYFDAWAQELTTTGYLHNHARMWFASIWIFTLELPWRLGADFFYRHLLDGDAAANTLNWRWAAGLHTRGKPYPATPQNIEEFTRNRFAPADGELAKVTEGLEATEPDGLPTVQPLRELVAPREDVPAAILITDEDCLLEDFDLASLDVRAVATLSSSHLRSPLPVSAAVQRFEDAALLDAADRLGGSAGQLKASDAEALASWAVSAGAEQIVTPYVTHGPLRDWLDASLPVLAKHGVTLCELRRDWDSAIWPFATAGFFKVKKQIPQILETTVYRAP